MPRNKYSLQDVANIVESEGLDYAITGYMGADRIEDAELAKQWNIAREALEKIEEILKPYMP